MRRPTETELIDLALGRLPPSRREEVEQYLRDDVALAVRAREIREHLRRYDALPLPPPPPPAPRVPASRPVSARPRSALRVAAVGLGAAALILVTILWTRPHPAPASRTLVATLTDRWTLSDRVEVVLEGGSTLNVRDAGLVELSRGRAFFEVRPGTPFTVRTPGGAVEVRGTVFEVVVAGPRLQVRVAAGRVAVGSHVLEAGEALTDGRVHRWQEVPGAFFRRPALQLRVTPGRTTEVRFTLSNPGRIPMDVQGPEGVRVALWLEVRGPTGETRDIPLEIDHPDVVPGRRLTIPALGSVTFTARVADPFGEPGTYRCRAMYRPEGEPPLVSDTTLLEVR